MNELSLFDPHRPPRATPSFLQSATTGSWLVVEREDLLGAMRSLLAHRPCLVTGAWRGYHLIDDGTKRLPAVQQKRQARDDRRRFGDGERSPEQVHELNEQAWAWLLDFASAAGREALPCWCCYCEAGGHPGIEPAMAIAGGTVGELLEAPRHLGQETILLAEDRWRVDVAQRAHNGAVIGYEPGEMVEPRLFTRMDLRRMSG